ncbi:MAG TPA: CsbD family protein [Methanosarcina sp.]|nr:CsbD family protein [Methanosarcina sp.]
MKTSTRDQAEGKLHKVKGEIKETVGELINDPYLEAEGKVEKTEGKAQEKAGQIKKVMGK